MEVANEGFDHGEGGSVAFAIFGGEALGIVRDDFILGMSRAGLPEAMRHRG